MSLFSRPPDDPIRQQMRRLEEEQRALEREMARLQQEFGEPTEPRRSDTPVEIIPPHGQGDGSPPPPRPLGVHHRRARRRALAVLGVLLVLALVIWRVMQG